MLVLGSGALNPNIMIQYDSSYVDVCSKDWVVVYDVINRTFAH